MAFAVDALQSRSRQRNHEMKNSKKFQQVDYSGQGKRRDEPLVKVISEAVKSLTDAVFKAMDSFWEKNTVTATKPCSDPILNDFTVGVEMIIVSKQTFEDGFVEVPLGNEMQTSREHPPSIANTKKRLTPSAPIDIPKSRIVRPKRKDRNFM